MRVIIPLVVALVVLGYLATFLLERRRRRRFVERATRGEVRPEDLAAAERDGIDNPIAAEAVLREAMRDPGRGGMNL